MKEETLRETYVKTIENILQNALEIVRKKSADYAADSDPFQNFRNSALFAGVSVEQGIMVRLADKYSRIRNLLQKNPEATAAEGGAVGEAIEDTLSDAVNYTAILLTWLLLERPAPGEVFVRDEEAEFPDQLRYLSREQGNQIPDKNNQNWLQTLIAKATK